MHSNVSTRFPAPMQAMPEIERCDELPVQLSKLLAALASAVVASVGVAMPAGLQEMIVLMLLLVIADTLSGVYAAAYLHDVQSRKIVDKLVNKGVVYSIAGLLGYVACALTNTWLWQYALLSLLMSREIMSLIEIAKRLMAGGKNFGPMDKFLTRLGEMFADKAEQAVAVVVKTPETTVVVAPPAVAETVVKKEGQV